MKRNYWLGFALLLGAGTAAAWTRLVPTQNTATFLFALLFLWNGSLLLLNRNPVYRVEPGRHRRIFGSAVLALGLLWLPISVHEQADRGLFQLATAAPLLLVLLAAHIHYKKKGNG